MDEASILSIVPPVLTILVALYSKNVIVALIVGILSGSLIITEFRPFAAILDAIENQVLCGIYERHTVPGADHDDGDRWICKVARGLRWCQGVRQAHAGYRQHQGQSPAARLGIRPGDIFTDSGNSLIIGPLYRSVFDEFKLCREKLAYILDTTSSPISILIPFIGWGAYIMSLIEKSYAEIGLTENEFTVLIKVIPYNFYAFLALLTVPVVIMTGKDYGPMLRIQNDPASLRSSAPTESDSGEDQAASTPVGMFLYPLGVMLGLVTVLISWHATHDGITGAHIRSTLIISYLTASLTTMELMRRHQAALIPRCWAISSRVPKVLSTSRSCLFWRGR